jgi:hypothetical protein
MKLFAEYPCSVLCLVIFILVIGAVSSSILTYERIAACRIIGNVLQAIIVGIVIFSFGIVQRYTMPHIVIISCFSAMTWPHSVNIAVACVRRSLNKYFSDDEK